MPRVVIELPQDFMFNTEVQVCVNDLNSANHVGNDRFVTYINEAYFRFLHRFGLTTEASMMIMTDLTLVYISEAHYGDRLKIAVAVSNFGRKSCNFYYLITNKKTGKEVIRAKCGVIFFDYKNKQAVNVPENIRRLSENLADP